MGVESCGKSLTGRESFMPSVQTFQPALCAVPLGMKIALRVSQHRALEPLSPPPSARMVVFHIENEDAALRETSRTVCGLVTPAGYGEAHGR